MASHAAKRGRGDAPDARDAAAAEAAAEAAEELLQCPVCYDLPEGNVYQVRRARLLRDALLCRDGEPRLTAWRPTPTHSLLCAVPEWAPHLHEVPRGDPERREHLPPVQGHVPRARDGDS
jgi:hypothetical protein